jgi:uncharacterized damage-inducible protein DinB
MIMPFPSPTNPIDSRTEVFLGYLDYFRSRAIDKVQSLPEPEVRSSRLPSGWTPIELANHLAHVEMRWLEWRFLGVAVPEPWGDQRDGRWYVPPVASTPAVLAALRARGAQTRRIVESADPEAVGAPGERWDGNPPPRLERILFHLLQEYARHLGQLDVVAELAGGQVGE